MAKNKNKQREIVNQLITDYNKKMKEFNKRGIEVDIISPSERKNILRNKEDYDLIMGKLKIYMKRDAFKKIDDKFKYEKELSEYYIDKINKSRKKRFEEYKPSTFTGTMGTIEASNLKPRKNNIENIPAERRQDYLKSLEKTLLYESSNKLKEQYKSNLVTAIERMLYGANNFEKLYNLVNSMSAEDLIRYYYTSPYASIDFVYDDNQTLDVIVDYFYDEIKEYDNLQ